MVSVIITSFKEPKTIRKCINSIANRKYSNITSPFEIIQVSPDELTLKEGRKEANALKLSRKQYIQIKDPKRGKPYALKMAFGKAKGEYIVMTDGDVYFGEGAVGKLLEPFENKEVGGVSGHPVSQDSRNDCFGYWGHLLSDSADNRRRATARKVKNRSYYISTKNFFPMSGYIMAIRNVNIPIPSDVLSDDAFISYHFRNEGFEIAYAPNALCYVKYPTNLKDYYKQKVRSIGGFKQLERLGIFKRDKQSRSFLIELSYALWAIKYPRSFREFLWTILLFPVRLITWLKIFWERGILRKGMPKGGWERIETTK